MRHRAARRALGQRAGMPNDGAFAVGDAAPSRRISSIVETLFRQIFSASKRAHGPLRIGAAALPNPTDRSRHDQAG
jgi:hypothetical protein